MGSPSRTSERRPPPRAWYAIVATGVVVMLLHSAGLFGSAADLTFVGFGLATLISTGVGIRLYRPALRWPWMLITAAALLWLLTGAARAAFETTGDLTAQRSLIPDLISFPGYLLMAVALSGIASARRRGQDGNLDTLLDACVAALAVLALAWVYLIGPTISNGPVPATVRAVIAVTPTMSVFMVGAVMRLAFSPSTRRVPAYLLLLSSMSFLLVGDIVYIFVEVGAIHVSTAMLDLPYLAAYLFFTACALHPSMADLTRPVTEVEAVPGRSRLNLVGVALIVPPIVLSTRGVSTMVDRVVLLVVLGALTIVTVWRTRRALHRHAQSESRLAHQATHDSLTGLPNQLGFRERVEARGLDESSALLFVDVDRFKLVNDTYGHSIGDELLVSVSSRLEGAVRSGDLVARIGGDEFLVLLHGVESRAHGMALADAVRLAFAPPFQLDVAEIYAAASVGVAFAEAGGQVEELIRDADTAMYVAKASGRDTVAAFDGSMRDRVSERLGLEHDLRQALGRGELHLAYQPVIGYPAGSVSSVEALLRWTHPERGELPPAVFIPVAEESGLIVEIGDWVLQEACRNVAEWRRWAPGASHLQVAVNLSARQLRDPQIVSRVSAALAAHELPPDALCLELTESLLIEDPEAATHLLQRLRDLGVKLSIDDFGTGYSSLSYLKRFPVHVVKIDRSFVMDMAGSDTSDSSLVAAIIAMAGALGLATVAEGVETRDQEQRLVELGCDAGQGYLYCRPVPASELPAVLRRHGSHEPVSPR